MTGSPLRGQVYRADLGQGATPWLVVSNNQRNRRLDSVLAARITTTGKSGIPTAVPLGQDDPLVGHVLVDDLVALFDDEIAVAPLLGSLSPRTLREVNRALAIALGLP